MAKTYKGKNCYFCGKAGSDTREHIPPQGLFPEKLPKNTNLITVPAHATCNHNFTKDDELFRNIIVMESSRSKDAKSIWNGKVSRSFENIGGETKKADLRSRIVMKTITTPITGANIPVPTNEMSYEKSIIDRVMTRFIRGLYYNECGKFLDATIPINVWKQHVPEISKEQLGQQLGQSVQEQIVVPNVFSYYYVHSQEKQGIGVFVMAIFYETVVFSASAITGDKKVQEPQIQIPKILGF